MHFTVMVQIPKEKVSNVSLTEVDNYLEEVLAPFNEQDERFFTVSIYETKEGAKEELEELIKQSKNDPDSYAAKLDMKHGLSSMSLEEFISFYYGMDTDEEGNVLSLSNPNAQWDWWVIGGRWDGLLYGKDGQNHDYLRVKDIDFEGMNKRDAEKVSKTYDKVMEETSYNDMIRNIVYGIKPGMTKEEYIAQQSSGLSTFAVLDKEEKWIKLNDEEKVSYKQKFIDPLDPDDIIAIVDCHI